MLQIAVELVAAIDVNDDGMCVNYPCALKFDFKVNCALIKIY